VVQEVDIESEQVQEIPELPPTSGLPPLPQPPSMENNNE
jgi:hypothetical protein